MAPMLKVSNGLKNLLQAGLQRKSSSKISYKKMPQKWTQILSPL